MKAIVITKDQWDKVWEKIKKDYPPSVWLSREKMRRVLGFTHREHTSWLGYYHNVSLEDRRDGLYGYKVSIHLDFFNENQRTMFLLKFGDKIGNQVENS